MLTKAYWGLGGGLLALYLAGTLLGWEPFAPRKKFLPAEARQGPSGYRSFHFWRSGYSGGK